MSKYIIEIEDKPFVRLSALFGEEGLYRAKGFNSLVFDQFGLDKLTPLDKELEEAYQKGYDTGSHEATMIEYQQGLNDAWEAARKICNEPEDGGLPAGAVVELFGRNGPILGCSAQNAINKIKAYEEQQKADGIKVGDEVEWEGEKIIVTQTFTPNLQKPQLHGIGSNGCVYYAILIEDVKKTGRHFPQVVELIKAMKEGAE